MDDLLIAFHEKQGELTIPKYSKMVKDAPDHEMMRRSLGWPVEKGWSPNLEVILIRKGWLTEVICVGICTIQEVVHRPLMICCSDQQSFQDVLQNSYKLLKRRIFHEIVNRLVRTSLPVLKELWSTLEPVQIEN